MNVVEKVIAILSLNERQLAAHRFTIYPSQHLSLRPPKPGCAKERRDVRTPFWLFERWVGEWESGESGSRQDRDAVY